MNKEIVQEKSDSETQAEPKRIQLDRLSFCWLFISFFIYYERKLGLSILIWFLLQLNSVLTMDFQ